MIDKDKKYKNTEIVPYGQVNDYTEVMTNTCKRCSMEFEPGDYIVEARIFGRFGPPFYLPALSKNKFYVHKDCEGEA